MSRAHSVSRASHLAAGFNLDECRLGGHPDEQTRRDRRRRHPHGREAWLCESDEKLFPLLCWAGTDEHLAGPEGSPLVLHHTACGHDAAPVLVCHHCAQPIAATDILPGSALALTQNTPYGKRQSEFRQLSPARSQTEYL